MLVLTRKLGERIVLAHKVLGKIIISVCEIDRTKVRIGIDAPRDVSILREELLEPRQEEGTGNGSPLHHNEKGKK